MAPRKAAALQQAFPPVANRQARVLILGSMPDVVSLTANQYYAHPRNAFWPIMTKVLQLPAEASYRQRLLSLQRAGIALWDVAAACERPGSLDADIRHDTLIANDFTAFLAQHRRIHQLFFNGQSVANLFRRHVQGHQALPPGLQLQVLPSTSPANARLSLAQKVQVWQQALANALN